MWIMLAVVSALMGAVVAYGRTALLPFIVLLVVAYLVARRSTTSPALIAASTALPAVIAVAVFGSAGLVDAWLSHVVALLVLGGLAWLIADRAGAGVREGSETR